MLARRRRVRLVSVSYSFRRQSLTSQDSDYKGALNAGLKALLLRRLGLDGEQAHRSSDDEALDGVEAVEDLNEVIRWVNSYNNRTI